MCKSFFPTVCCMDLVYYMYILCQTFFVLSSQYFEKVFVCGFIILFLCCFCFVVAASVPLF